MPSTNQSKSDRARSPSSSPQCSSTMVCGKKQPMLLEDGKEYTVDVGGLTRVFYQGWARPPGAAPSMRILFGTDPKVSYGGQTSLAFKEGTTIFVAGPSIPNTDLNHTPPKPSLLDDSSVNTAVPGSEFPDRKVPDSEAPDNKVPK